MTQFLELGNE